MFTLFESNETNFETNGLMILDDIIVSCEVEQKINDFFVAELSFILDKQEKYKEITNERIIVLDTPIGEQPFRVVDTDIQNMRLSVFCKHVFSDISRRFINRCKVDSGNGAFTLNKMISSLDKTVPHTFTSNIATNASFDWVRKKPMTALFGEEENSFVSRYGGELWIDGWNASINTRIGTDRGFTALYRKNIKEFKGNISTDSLLTRIFPVGFDGITLEGVGYVDSLNVDKYSDIYADTIKFENIKYAESPNNSSNEGYETLEEAQAALVQACLDYFENTKCDLPTCDFEIDIVMLRDTAEYKNVAILEALYLGDDVYVEIEPLNLVKVKSRMMQYKYNSITQKYIKINLGKIDKSDIFKDINNKFDEFPNKDEVSNQLQTTIDKAFENLDDAITNGGNNSYIRFLPNFKNPSEILALDNEDIAKAVNVVRINQAGIGLSSTGVNGTYQGITTNGKLAISEVTAHQITANLIKLGMLSDITGKTWINMENGNFNFADKITFDGSTFKILLSDGKEINEKITEIVADSNEIKLDVKNSGGDNLVKNSGFKTGDLRNWVKESHGDVIGEFVTEVKHDDNEWCLYTKSMYSGMSTGGYGEKVLKQLIDTVPGKTYTLSYLIAGHRSRKEVRVRNSDWVELAPHKTYEDIYGGRDINNWVKDSITFTATTKQTQIWFAIVTAGENLGYLWLTDVIVNEGEVEKPWQPHSNEVLGSSLKLTDSNFEVAFTNGTKMLVDKDMPLTLVDGETKRQYHALMETGHLLLGGELGIFPKEAWVQLPDIFKNTNFVVNTGVAQTSGGLDDGEVVQKILQGVLEYDYPNGRFKVTGGWWAKTDSGTVYEKELDLLWIAIA